MDFCYYLRRFGDRIRIEVKFSAHNLRVFAGGNKARGVMVEALRYKQEVRGFDSRLCHWMFSMTEPFRSTYDPGGDSTSKRNEVGICNISFF
jgi:hypothetical protein